MESKLTRCIDCGESFAQRTGPGRPWVRCRPCAADKTAIGKTWREAHPDKIASYRFRAREAELAGLAAQGVRNAAARLADLRRRRATA